MKKLFSLMTAFVIMSTNVSAADAVVYVDGMGIEGAYTAGDTLYVPLDEIGKALGASLSQNTETGAVTMQTGGDMNVINTIEALSESVVAIVGNYDDGSTSEDVRDYNESYAHGAGVVIKSNGTILTNAHVVKDIKNLTVIFGDGKTYAGMVKYIDETSDLAVVRINKLGLKPVTFAKENDLVVGQSVIAIGTPLSVNHINSASKGIVSGVDVNIGQHYLFTQSDVAINGGNSGGPLVNLKGELVGINSMKYSGLGVEGMSFSIPVDTINYVLSSFEKYGKVLRPDTGITFTESWEAKIGVPTKKGLSVTASKNSSILPGDVITNVNGYEVHSTADYNEALKKSFNGISVTLTYTRGGISNITEIFTK